MDTTMEIELLISSKNTSDQDEISRLSSNESEINIGHLQTDQIKLKAEKLKGCRAKMVQSWNPNDSAQQLIFRAGCNSKPLEVDGAEIHSGESVNINENSKIRMGDYQIRARLGSTLQSTLQYEPQNKSSLPINCDNPKLDLQSFNLEELSLSSGERNLTTNNHSDRGIRTDEFKSDSIDLKREQSSLQDVEPKTFEFTHLTPAAANSTKQKPNPQNKITSTTIDSLANNVINLPTEKICTSGSKQKKPAHSPVPTDPTDTQLLFNNFVGEENLLDLDFSVLKLLTISGRITHQNTALKNITINAGMLGKCQTDADGYFVFTDVLEGSRYEIQVELNGYRLHEHEALNGILTQNRDISITTLKLSRVSGKITHNGLPIAGVRLDAGQFGTCESDKNGLYVFHDIPENCRLQIRASHPGYQFSTSTAEESSGPEKPIINTDALNTVSKDSNLNKQRAKRGNNDLDDSLAALMNY